MTIIKQIGLLLFLLNIAIADESCKIEEEWNADDQKFTLSCTNSETLLPLNYEIYEYKARYSQKLGIIKLTAYRYGYELKEAESIFYSLNTFKFYSEQCLQGEALLPKNGTTAFIVRFDEEDAIFDEKSFENCATTTHYDHIETK